MTTHSEPTPTPVVASALDAWRREHLGRLLLRAFQIFEGDMLAGLAENGIGGLRLSHFAVLRNTDRTGSRLTEIAARAGLTKQAIGPLVHELVTMGVLSMAPDPTDGRARMVRFTPAGERGLHTARSVYRRVFQRYTELVGDDCMDELVAHLVTFVVAAERPTVAAGEPR